REKIAAALKKAKRTTSDEMALAIITDALALDPSNPELTAERERRQSALESARAIAARKREVESTRQAIVRLVAAAQLDAAQSALHEAEQRFPDERLAFKDVRRKLERRLRQPHGSSWQSALRPAYLGIAVGVLMAVVAAGYFFNRSGGGDSASPDA